MGQDFVGAYLQGSFAVGDFDRHSDVDFDIVIEKQLSEAQVEALQIMHPRLYRLESAWAQHLEGSYFPKDILRDYSQTSQPLWYLDHGSQSLIQSTHCNTIVVRWVLRESGVVLAGPDPETLIDPIPVHVLRQEMLGVMHSWGGQILADPERINNRFYQCFAVLSYCRMLRDFLTGSVGSKRAGAEWVKANLDPAWSGLIDRAWSGRPDPAHSVRQPADPKELQSTLEFIRYLLLKSAQVAQDIV